MIKKIVYLFFISMTAVFIQSCSSDSDDYDDWKAQNETAFAQTALNPDYKTLTPQGSYNSILYKVLEPNKAPGDTAILGSKVKVRYTGKMIDGTIFDTTEKTKESREFTVTYPGLIQGWIIALQNMAVGDKWEIWVPWYLAYGGQQYSSIPPYSTLIFEMEVISVNKYPN